MLGVAGSVTSTGSAQTEDARRADLFERARTALAEGRGDEARELYLRLFRETAASRALFGVVQAERLTGAWVAAYEHVEALLGRDDPWLADVERRARILEARDDVRAHVGVLVLAALPADGAIWLDGERLYGPPGERVVMTAGLHRVRVESASADTSPTYDVVVPPSAPGDGPLAEVALLVEVVPNASAEPAQLDAPVARTDERPRTTRVGTGLLGGAVAAFGLGATSLALRVHAADRWNDDARCDRITGTERADECPDEARRLRRTAIGTPTSFVLGLGLVGVGVTLLVRTPERSPALACVPTIGATTFGGLCVRAF